MDQVRKGNKTNIVSLYLDAIARGVSGGEGEAIWPLLPAQANPYFEVDQAMEVYSLIKEYKKILKKEEIAKLFRFPGVLRNFLRNAGIIGLKVANRVGAGNFSTKEKVDYLVYLLDLIATMVQSDPLCVDNENRIFTQKQINEYLELNWQKATSETRRIVNGLYVDLFGWMWSTHFNFFVGAGLEPHGPYNVSKKFGENSQLLVRDFHGAYCPELWNSAKKLPFRRVKFFQIYRNIDIGINFENQVITKEGLGAYLDHFLIEVDGDFVYDLNSFEEISKKVTDLTAKQTKFVNSSSKFEQVRMAAKISQFTLKGVYDYGKYLWWKPEVFERNIKELGDKFIKLLGDTRSFSREYFRIVNDPRNDLVGEDALRELKKTEQSVN